MVTTLPEKLKELYPFKSNYYRLKSGYNYHYVDEGKGETVLMLHGNPSWSFLFRNLIKKLSEEYRVIAPDHLGLGLSDKPGDFPYRLETHIDNLEEFIDALGLKNITLLMHDWGGPIGMGCAERYPEKIKRIIITNTAAFTFHKIPLRLAVCRIPYFGEFIVQKLNLFAKFATLMTTVNPMPSDVKAGYLFPFQIPGSRNAVSRFVMDIPVWPDDVSYELLVRIEHGLWVFKEYPICIIWGMKDWCFSKKILRRWLDFLPSAEVHKIKKAGHFLFEDKFEEIYAHVVDFLKKTSNVTQR
jgi:haloalkane dehalogenase